MSGPATTDVDSDESATTADAADAGAVDDVVVISDGDDSSRRTGSDRTRQLVGRLLPWVAVAVPVVALAWRSWERRWMTDDGFINLRVVDMVLTGHGPVFNAGERVEVTTSTLWLWVLLAGEVLLPLPLEWIAVLLGIVLTVAGLVLVTAASASLWRTATASGTTTDTGADRGQHRSMFWLPAGSALLVALPPVADYATSGLEGGLTFAWVGAVAWVLARWVARPGPLGLGAVVLVGLGPLVRPDAAVVSAVVLLGVLAVQWRDGGWGARGRFVAAAAALPFAYQLFRMGYYGAVVPNTALAKNAGRARWDTGLFYLTDLFRTYWLLVPLVLLLVAVGSPLVAAARRHQSLRLLVAVVALPLAGVLQAVYIVRVGGDYMHARLLLPALWAVVAPFAVVPVPALRSLRRPATVLQFGLLGGLAVWVVVCAVGGGLRHPGIRFGPHSVVADGRNGLSRGLGVAHPISTADHHWGEDTVALHDLDVSLVWAEAAPLPADPPDDLRTPATAMWGVGAVGYALGPDFYIVDMLGLADPIQSRLIVENAAQPGHEKTMPHAWLVARVSEDPIDPELLPRPALVGMLYESPPGELDDDVEAARTVLSCPQIEELLEAVRSPMTPARFVENLLTSPRLTRIEIPPDPQEAAETLC